MLRVLLSRTMSYFLKGRPTFVLLFMCPTFVLLFASMSEKPPFFINFIKFSYLKTVKFSNSFTVYVSFMMYIAFAWNFVEILLHLGGQNLQTMKQNKLDLELEGKQNFSIHLVVKMQQKIISTAAACLPPLSSLVQSPLGVRPSDLCGKGLIRALHRRCGVFLQVLPSFLSTVK